MPANSWSTNHQEHVMTVCYCILSYTREDFNNVNGFNNEESREMQMVFMLRLEIFSSSYEIALRCMLQNLSDDKSILVQVMAWCHQATSHYLSQCWLRSLFLFPGNSSCMWCRTSASLCCMVTSTSTSPCHVCWRCGWTMGRRSSTVRNVVATR